MPLSKSPSFNLALLSMGIKTPLDVLKHLPRRYDSYAYTPRNDLHVDKERIVLLGRLRSPLSRPLRFSHRSLYRFYFESVEGEVIQVEAWNRDYLGKFLVSGELYTLSGFYDKKRNCLSLNNILKGEIKPEESLKPIYALPKSISNHSFVSLVKRCLEMTSSIDEPVPPMFMKKYRLINPLEAYKKVHEPTSLNDVHAGMRLFKYEEALSFSLKNQIVREENRSLFKDHRRQIDMDKLRSFISSLPYKMTDDQRKAMDECLVDMDSPHVMYRLLQGDVGTGKTLVAALLAYANHLRSEQTALLAPTDSLARQHYENLTSLFKGTNMTIGLLTGNMSSEERRGTLEDLEDGTIDLIIGTHALFSKGVNYAYLGLAIIDEQHKFGVNQRALLLDKGEHADLLLMSATPIPRTLCLTIYGDLDVSTLSSFPSGKRDVATLIKKPDDASIQKMVVESIDSSHRVYVVVPQIEGEDDSSLTSVKKVYERYSKLYPNKVTMLHGKMNEEEKESANLAFRSGLCPILVATSLIEVGIDVKPANLMIIYSPSHFSLSSLHQLRGRIGRDGSKANCVLAYEGDEEEEMEKLQILVSNDDGFKIAEDDLRLRGPGELAGTRQSGLPDLIYSNLIDDFKIYEVARDDATYILRHREEEGFEEAILKAEKGVKDISLA
jgi:ATP-dependent DNA helicase RecG